MHPDTLAVTAGRPAPEPGGPVNVPISMSATFHSDGDHHYGREQNDTWAAFESVLGALEGGRAVGFASGLAAGAAVLEGLPTGAVVVMPQSVYFGFGEMLRERQRLGRLTVRAIDATDAEAMIAAAAGADLVWIESPMNPTMAICDIERVADGAHAHGALVLCDNTFATPICQRPLDLGADIVLHSVTKFIGGHSDLLMGACVTRDDELLAELEGKRSLYGAIPGSLTAFLALRGLRTLGVRIERAQASAGVLAERLAAHPGVLRVRYPGLHDDPGHAVAARQMTGGFGAMLAFETHGDARLAEDVRQACRVIVGATSLGGVESLLERRGRYPSEVAAGTPETLLRMSVGIEHVDDLWNDLEQALRLAIPR